MDRALGRRRALSLRSHAVARRGVFDRHAAADGQRLAARRPRLLLHPHRRRRPLPAHARQGRVLSDGMGRQRPADRAPRAELLRRALRSVAAVRPGVRAAGEAGQAADSGLASELHRAVRAADGRGREGVRAAVAASRPVGRLVDDLRDHRPPRAAAVAAGVPAAASARGLAYQLEAPTLWDVDFRTAVAQAELEDREQPGAYHRIRFAQARRSRLRRDRHDAARADSGVRRARRPSRRSTLSAALRHRGRHAALRRARAGAGAHARRSREGHRRRDDLHLRRHHRRRLVARARPAGARGHPGERHVQARDVGRGGLGVRPIPRARSRPTTSSPGSRRPRRASARSSSSARAATSSASRGRSRTPSSSTRRATARSRS